jgi:Flp pilus assembly protein TadG
MQRIYNLHRAGPASSSESGMSHHAVVAAHGDPDNWNQWNVCVLRLGDVPNRVVTSLYGRDDVTWV